MSIHSLIYISRATGGVADEALRRLHALSERNNRRRDITGALGFTGHFFLQYVEGREDAVSATMRAIRRNSRHSDLIECMLAPTTRRRFGQWSMRYFDSQSLDADVRKAHESGVLTAAGADWLIGRMIQVLPPGHTLHDIDA